MRPDLPDPARLALALLLVLLPFWLWPQLDLWLSALFRDHGDWADSAASQTLRMTLWRLAMAVLFLAVAGLALSLWGKRPAMGLSARLWTLILGTYALGPGVLVDLILKRLWGRARPADILDFGGTLSYSPPWLPSDQCQSNCSFVSGEVSGLTAATIALLILLSAWRDRLAPATHDALRLLILSLPFVTALQRMASGRHFLSDVIFAALFTLLIAACLRVALFGRGAPIR